MAVSATVGLVQLHIYEGGFVPKKENSVLKR